MVKVLYLKKRYLQDPLEKYPNHYLGVYYHYLINLNEDLLSWFLIYCENKVVERLSLIFLFL
jgi:hypothetical protein